jgi:hypothetical protein
MERSSVYPALPRLSTPVLDPSEVIGAERDSWGYSLHIR